MNRRDFLKGIGALLACYGGAKLIPTQQRNELIEWGRENDVIRPVWQGWTPTAWIVQGKQVTWYTGDNGNFATGSISLLASPDMVNQWLSQGPRLGDLGNMHFGFAGGPVYTVAVCWESLQEFPDGSGMLWFLRRNEQTRTT